MEFETLKKIIAEVGATSKKEMGKVMGTASKQLAGKCQRYEKLTYRSKKSPNLE